MSSSSTHARRARIAALAPVVLASFLSVAVVPQWRSVAAPLLGPWAGLLYGHSDCTMARAAPVWSAACGLLIAAALAALLCESSRRRTWTALLAFVATLSWSLAALASVANTQS